MTARAKKRIILGISVLILLVLLLPIVGPLIPYKKVDFWVGPVSGSTKSQVTWFGCVSHDERTASALEEWLVRKEPTFAPQWQHLSTTTYYILGRGNACGPAPEVYHLKPILDGVVGRFSDERIGNLVSVLRRGSLDDQRQAIQRISEDFFDANQ